MRRGLVALLLAGAAMVAGCGDSGGDSQEVVGSKVRLKAGESLDGAQECGVDQAPCPSGLSCVTIPFEGSAARALCVNEQAICEQLECTTGECAVLESFPARVTCVSRSDRSPDDELPDSYYP